MSKSTIDFANRKHVHFMGIGGSGMSAVAILAHKMGYKVSGCDLQTETPYLKQLKANKTLIFSGHDQDHLKDVDILAVTPAAFFQSTKHSEFKLGKKKGILMTWQKFLGEFLQKDKKVICISGTHGKSTTTAMASLVFEKANKDPNVMIGAKVKSWDANYRYGKGNIFITESDEFFDNFLNYYPTTIVLNNIEWDHLDYFRDEKHVLESFKEHLGKLQERKILIINQDSPGIKKLLSSLGRDLLKSLDIYGYTLNKNPLIKVSKSVNAKVTKRTSSLTEFEVEGKGLDINGTFGLKIAGDYNVSNALGVLILSKLFKINQEIVKKVLARYSGIDRRMELIGKKGGVYVYDDYAHHPTAVKATLKALKQKHPAKKILAIIEAHSFSRTRGLLNDYKGVFAQADEVIIAPIFKARDKEDFGIDGQKIVDISGHHSILYIDSFKNIVKHVVKSAELNDVIIVMGAGKSYQLARNIVEAI